MNSSIQNEWLTRCARLALTDGERATARYWLNHRLNRLPHKRRPLPAPVQFRHAHNGCVCYADVLRYVCEVFEYPQDLAAGFLWNFNFSALCPDFPIFVVGEPMRVSDEMGMIRTADKRGAIPLADICSIDEVFVPLQWVREVFHLVYHGVGGLKTRITEEPLDYAFLNYGYGYTQVNVLVDWVLERN